MKQNDGSARPPRYVDRYRRLLIDTHIPDWDPGFLRRFDPAAIVDAARHAGVTGLMVYFQSHTGLCHWPTTTGKAHPAFSGRDVIAEVLGSARRAELPVCAYYSVNFNNWAYEAHPEWRLAPVRADVIGGGLLERARYGICCFNHRGYAAFVVEQAREILTRYDVDAFFFDMVWWMSVCVCDSCRARFRAEAGAEIPTVVDWLDPRWCTFQSARERWLTEFAHELRDTVRALRSGIPVYHNFALGAANWTRAVSFDSAAAHDFLGGDFYGGSEEQSLVSHLMLNLSAHRPVEFMTTVTANLVEHERLKSDEELATQGLTATACHAAFLAILAFDPDGAVNPAGVERVRRLFELTAPYEPFLGGTPVEEIVVYFSGASKMNFADNGRPLAEAASGSPVDYPHLHAVGGACRILQEAHLPFGVITRRQIAELSRYQVIVLPDVLRMDEGEITAFREFVRAGGRLYASRYTSLTSVVGERADDFLLADVFGCHFDSIESGRSLYLAPASPLTTDAIAPERYLSHWSKPTEATGAVRLRPTAEGRTLMTLSLPYGYPSRGSAAGKDWSSIHSFPPWEHTTRPTVVEHEFGRGRVIYSAADLEAGRTASHDALFLALVRALLGAAPAYEAAAHRNAWMIVFDQPAAGRLIVSFVNNAPNRPVTLPPATFRLRPPPGRRFRTLCELPAGKAAPFAILADGTLAARLAELASFAMLAAEYE